MNPEISATDKIQILYLKEFPAESSDKTQFPFGLPYILISRNLTAIYISMAAMVAWAGRRGSVGEGNTPCTVMGAILYSLTVSATRRTRIAISAAPRHINKHLFRALAIQTRTHRYLAHINTHMAVAMLLSFSVYSCSYSYSYR